jgi:hypothetical protein
LRTALRVLLVVFVGGFPVFSLLLADIAVVPAIERRLENLAGQPGASAVDAQLAGFPITARAIATGEVKEVSFRYSEAKVGPLRADVVLRLKGVAVERGRLFDGVMPIDGVESGNLEVTLPYSQVERVVGLEIDASSGRPLVSASAGQEIELEFSASAQSLVVSGDGLDAVTVPFGTEPLPCAPEVGASREGVEMACPFRGVPGFLRS